MGLLQVTRWVPGAHAAREALVLCLLRTVGGVSTTWRESEVLQRNSEAATEMVGGDSGESVAVLRALEIDEIAAADEIPYPYHTSRPENSRCGSEPPPVAIGHADEFSQRGHLGEPRHVRRSG